MKVNVINKLESELSKRKESDKQNVVLNEAKGLLEYDAARDVSILRNIGSSSSFVQSETERGEILELERKEKFYGGKIFTKDAIIKLGAKYRLKFLQSQYFKDYLDPTVVLEIKSLEREISKSMDVEQAQKRNMSLEDYITANGKTDFKFDDYQLKNKFYILAPPSSFKTERTRAISLKAIDPILFYSDDEIHFRSVKKWGADFTIFRRILGFSTHTWFRHLFIYEFLWLLLALSLSIFISPFFLFMCAATIISSVIFLVNAANFEERFVGERHVTSTMSFYI